MIWQTHEVSNQYEELADYSLYDSDPALREALRRATRAGPRPGSAPTASAWGGRTASNWPSKPTAMRRSCGPSTAAAVASIRWTPTRPGTSSWRCIESKAW